MDQVALAGREQLPLAVYEVDRNRQVGSGKFQRSKGAVAQLLLNRAAEQDRHAHTVSDGSFHRLRVTELDADAASSETGVAQHPIGKRSAQHATRRLDKRDIAQSVDVRFGPRQQLIIWRGNQEAWLDPDRFSRQTRDLGSARSEHDGEVTFADLDRADGMVGIDDAQLDLNHRPLAPESIEDRWEQIAAQRHARGEGDCAAASIGKPVEVATKLACARKHLGGPSMRCLARLGQLKLAPLAVEQLGAEAILERPEMGADHRLGRIELVGGTAHTLELDDQLEDLELLESDPVVYRDIGPSSVLLLAVTYGSEYISVRILVWEWRGDPHMVWCVADGDPSRRRRSQRTPARPAAATLPLAGGAGFIPQLGLGTWPLVGREATHAVLRAIDVGYRLIDTSEQYANEEAVGAALRESPVAREELFITSKFNARWHGEDLVERAFRRSARQLRVDYLDLFLIHWPNPWLGRYVDAWRGLVKLQAAGHVRAIGVSNFLEAHVDHLLEHTGVAPAVNQVELDPTLPRRALRAHHERHGIVTEAWSPLGRGGLLLADPRVVQIAREHSKSPAQVVLRWHIEQGLVAAVRSAHPQRIAENIDVFDFTMSTEQMSMLAELDQGRAPVRDPLTHGH